MINSEKARELLPLGKVATVINFTLKRTLKLNEKLFDMDSELQVAKEWWTVG